MENTQLELLKEENSQLKEQLELLEMKISELKTQSNLSSINSEIEDLVDDNDFKSSIHIGLWLDITFNEKNEDGLSFNIESSNDNFEYTPNEIEYTYEEISDWFEENNKPITIDNLQECIEELIEQDL